ncbi:MAG: hypothetical protein ACHQ49_06030 [Elusimicrobiota bacterium]
MVEEALSAAAGLSGLAWFCLVLVRGGVVWAPALFSALAFLWALKCRAPGRNWGARPVAAVFLGSAAIYLSTFRWHGGDDLPNILLPFAVLRHGTLALDSFIDPWLSGENHWYVLLCGGKYLSLYPPWTGLLSLPLSLLPWAFDTPITAVLLRDLSKISATLITAASVVFFWKSLSSRCSREWAWCLCLLYALGSWAFSVGSQALWQHGPAQMAVAVGLWGISEDGFRWDILAGFGFALAAAIRPDNVFFAAAVLAYLLLDRRRRLLGFCLGSIPPALFTAIYWLYYTGRLRPPELGFQSALFGGFCPAVLWALMASPTRGLLLFFPAAIFGAWGVWRRRRDRLGVLLLAACGAQWVMLSFYEGWVGGNTFGSRYFAVSALILTWLCAGIEKEIRSSALLLKSWSVCVGASVLIHSIGAYCPWPGPPSVVEQKAQAWSWGLHPLSYLVTTSRALGGIPVSARVCVLATALAAAGGAARFIEKRLVRRT